MRIEKRRVFHIQPLMKVWAKLHNPHASYFTAFFLITNIHIVMARCLIKHRAFLFTDPTHGKVNGSTVNYVQKYH